MTVQPVYNFFIGHLLVARHSRYGTFAYARPESAVVGLATVRAYRVFVQGDSFIGTYVVVARSGHTRRFLCMVDIRNVVLCVKANWCALMVAKCRFVMVW